MRRFSILTTCLAVLVFGACSGADASLVITKTAVPNPVVPGDNIVYTIDVTNDGGTDEENVDITDDLPAETIYISCYATGDGVCGGTGNSRTVTYASIAPGVTETVTLVAKVVAPVADSTSITNTAVVESSTQGPTSDNAVVIGYNVGCVGLLISEDMVSGDPAPYAGNTETWEVQITLQACTTLYNVLAVGNTMGLRSADASAGGVFVRPVTGIRNVRWFIPRIEGGKAETLVLLVERRIVPGTRCGTEIMLTDQWWVRYVASGCFKWTQAQGPVFVTVVCD